MSKVKIRPQGTRIGHDGIEMPLYRLQNEGPTQLIDRARKHLTEHDERAAVLYARLAFERKLKKYCTKRNVPVPYDLDPRKQSSEDFWDAIKKHDATAIKGVAAADVNMHRKVILNEFTHASAVTITRQEIIDAIATIEKLSLG